MNMDLKLNKICISGFKNYLEPTIFEFSNFTEIVGRNAQGKTTIAEAISWCFYGSDLSGDQKSDKELININSDCMFVIIDYIFNGVEYRLLRKKGKSLTIKLNEQRILEKELFKYIPDKDLFLAVFNPRVFLGLSIAQQRKALLKILPNINHDEIISKYKCHDLKEILDQYPDINIGIKQMLSEINSKKDLLISKESKLNVYQNLIIENTNQIEAKETFSVDDEKLLIDLQNQLTNKSNTINLLPTDEIKSKIYEINNLISLEENKIYKSEHNQSIQNLNISLAQLMGEFNALIDTYNRFDSIGSVCSMCGQEISEEHKFKELEILKNRMENLQSEISNLTENISIIKNLEEDNLKSFNKHKEQALLELTQKRNELSSELSNIEESNKLLSKLKLNADTNDIQLQIDTLKQKQSDYLSYQSNLKIQQKNVESYKGKIEIINSEIMNINSEITELEVKRQKLKNYSSLYIEHLSSILSTWLDKVSINLFTFSPTTGELKDTFEIKYDNKPIKRISNSENTKVRLEISNMFNQALNMQLPVFIDDAESILEIPQLPTQMIVARVKNCKLKINNKNIDYETTTSNSSNISILNDDDSNIDGEQQQFAFQ